MGSLKEEENMAPISFPLRAANEGGEGMGQRWQCPQAVLAEVMSQRTSPPCSPSQWVHSTCDVSKHQVFPGVLEPRIHRTLVAEDPHKEQGSSGTGLTIQAA